VSNVKFGQLKVDHIEEWAKDNNLVWNRSKSAELVIRTKSRRSVVEPSPAVPGFIRDKTMSLKVLNVTINCAQTMFAL